MLKNKIEFGIVGSGWRAECYIQVAKLLPELFNISGVVTRREARKLELEKKWGVKVFTSPDELLDKTKPDFILTAVSKTKGKSVLQELSIKNIPILAETPPAVDLKGLIDLHSSLNSNTRIQVAEQFFLQPMHNARLAVIQSGILGKINFSHISVNHGYHGISLMRKTLGIGFENARINAFSHEFPSVNGPGRQGFSEVETISNKLHTLAIIDFGHKVGLYDFEKNQHRSLFKSQRVLIRGQKGEINNNNVKYLKNFKTYLEFNLLRKNVGEDGNLEGYYLKGIIGEKEWIYLNPFVSARLSDEEIALASCLVKMKKYVNDGTKFYSLAEASQDQYITLMIENSIINKMQVETKKQLWAE